LISDGAQATGLGQTYAFGLFNLAWAGGQVIGGAGGAGLAQATSDAVPYALLAALSLATILVVRRHRVGSSSIVSEDGAAAERSIV
jgi:hypothetical protein